MSNVENFVEQLSDDFKLELFKSSRSGELEKLLTPAPTLDYKLLASQVPSEKDWWQFVMLSGRGGGKTFALTNWVKQKALGKQQTRIALLVPTMRDAAHVVDQLMRVHEEWDVPTYKRHLAQVQWFNGSTLDIYTSDNPDSANHSRGPQYHYSAVNEFTALKKATDRGGATAYQNLMVQTRLGEKPQMFLTGTPKADPELRKLLERAKDPKYKIEVARAFSGDNPALSPKYLGNLIAMYGNQSELILQEVYGIYIDEEGIL